MCGITGFFNFKSGAAAPDRDVLARMMTAIAHRGPDDEGMLIDRSVALGFRRLAIIDLSGGHQPMASDCGRYTLIFNGEIYNYQDVRAELVRSHGVSFRTNSDSEVILNAYRQWGAAAVERFNGMFGFAIWDQRDETLFLARDRFGKKPVFYVRTPEGFCFASEVKSLLQHPRVSAAVDVARLPAFLAYRYVPGDETLFRDVQCLPPASHLTVSMRAGLGEPVRYWDYSFAEPSPEPSVGASLEKLGTLVKDSVRLRMIADVPVGAFLSGGLDSSITVALMAKIHPERLKTFSIGFDTGFSEEGYARIVAKQFDTDHHEIIVSSQDLIAHMPAVLHARETPITEASDIPISLLARLARQKVTVVLSGEGSDEIFAGYPKYAFERRFGAALRLVPGAVLRGAAATLPFSLRRAQLALECLAQRDRFEGYAGWFGAFGPEARERLRGPNLPQADPHAFARAAVAGHTFPGRVDEMLYLDTRHWLPANLLLRGDRMAMAHSLELRCPFLDYRLAEFAAREMPTSQKIRGNRGKWLLQQWAKTFLPAEIFERPKWGFKVPLYAWFRGPLAKVFRDVMFSPAARARGYFNEAELRRLIDQHESGRINLEKQLWILFQLELWHLMYVDHTLQATDSLG